VLGRKKDNIYLKIYKLYYSYARDPNNKTYQDIFEASLELRFYGSKKISKLVDEIDTKKATFLEDIEHLLAEIRNELGVDKDLKTKKDTGASHEN
jgi:hypothetical protein